MSLTFSLFHESPPMTLNTKPAIFFFWEQFVFGKLASYILKRRKEWILKLCHTTPHHTTPKLRGKTRLRLKRQSGRSRLEEEEQTGMSLFAGRSGGRGDRKIWSSDSGVLAPAAAAPLSAAPLFCKQRLYNCDVMDASLTCWPNDPLSFSSSSASSSSPLVWLNHSYTGDTFVCTWVARLTRFI